MARNVDVPLSIIPVVDENNMVSQIWHEFFVQLGDALTEAISAGESVDFPSGADDSSVTDALGVTIATLEGGSGSRPAGNTGQVQSNKDGALGSSSNLFWDFTNNRLGLGTDEPTTKLHIDSATTPITTDSIYIEHETITDGTAGIAIDAEMTHTEGRTIVGAEISAENNAIVSGDNYGTYGITCFAYKTGADTSSDTTTTAGLWAQSANTGSTDAGTKNTYGGYFQAVGDTAGTSVTYGVFASGTGADTNYGIYSHAGTNYFAENITVGTTSPSGGFSGVGDIYATSGIKAMEGLYSEAVAFGAGLEVADNELATTYTNAPTPTATLTASTQTIYDPEASFTNAYVGQFLKVITSAAPSFTGATGEIILVTDGTHIVVSFGSTGGAAIPDATEMSFVIYPSPNAYVSDHGDLHFKVGASDDASFKIQSPTGINDHALHIVATAGINGHTAIDLDIDPGILGGVAGYGLNYDATAFISGISGTGLNMVIDNTGATGGDLHGIDVAVADTTNTDMEIVAVGTNEGVEVIHQHLGDAAVVASAWLYDSSATTYTDATTAFNSSGTNVEMFGGDNDQILIASATKFDQINVLMTIFASANIKATFTFSLENTGWTAFIPSDDTSGFQNNGTIRFDSDNLTNWDMQTVNQVTGEVGATDYYWVSIRRKRNLVPTLPTESTIQVTRTGTLHTWDSEGRLGIKTFNQAAEPTTTDLPTGKFCFWTDTDDSKLYICYNHGGTVKTTEMT